MTYSLNHAVTTGVLLKYYDFIKDDLSVFPALLLSPSLLVQLIDYSDLFDKKQILHSEYRLIYIIYWNHSMHNTLELLSEAGVCLQEFQRLLDGFIIRAWDWKVENISMAIDNLRNLNYKFLQYFFWKVWNPSLEKLGPIVLEILDCSLNSNYFLTLSHDKKPLHDNLECHICGNYKVQDLTNTLKFLLPDFPKNQHVICGRMLLCYICDVVRTSNLFHVLRLRWVCMDKALASGRRRETRNSVPLINDFNNNHTETTEDSKCGKKVIKIFTQNQPDFVDISISRLGIRCDFQLWCLLTEAPGSLTCRQLYLHCNSLPICDNLKTCTHPYHFKMEFKACVRAIRSRFTECTVWVEETSNNITVVQNKESII